MAFTDPQSITISGSAISLPRVSSLANASEYTSADGLVKLSAAHAYGRRVRRTLRVDHAKISADVFVPSQNVRQSMSCYMVFDLPTAGYTNAEAKAVYDGYKALISASSDAIITKLLGGES
jgi:hypothetical protein